MAPTPKIQFVDVTYTLPGGRVLFDGVSFQVDAGKVIMLVGPSGCGKSTLFKLITGRIHPDKGEIWVDGLPVHKMRGPALFEARRKMGLLFQSGALFTDLSVFENVAFPVREHLAMSESMLRDLVMLKLEAVGLRGAIDLMPHELSGGMTKRVALARAIMMDPQILLYDEPLTGQDPVSVNVLLRLMRNLNRSLEMTSIVVTHKLQTVGTIADQVLMVSNKAVIDCGAPTTLSKHKDPQVRQFVSGSLDDESIPFHFPAPDFKEALGL